MKASRQRNSRGGHPDLPIGAVQLCLPMKAVQPVPTSAVPPVPAQYDPSAMVECLNGLVRALEAAYYDLALRAAYTPQHCLKLERLFLHMRTKVQEYIALLDRPEYLTDQNILSRLRPLYRNIVEAVVVVRGVHGLCSRGCHMESPMGIFWQLVECVRTIARECQSIAQRCTPISRVASLHAASA